MAAGGETGILKTGRDEVCSARLFTICVGIIASLFLSACSLDKDVAGPPIINGNWASGDGIFTAKFLNGNFEAVANDTGSVISRGKYVVRPDATIMLRWDGLVSGRSNEANCTRADDNQMNCVDQDGRTFTLQRSVTETG